MRSALLLLLLAAGCAVVREPATSLPPTDAPEIPGVPPPPVRSESLAIAGLIDSARADQSAGRLANAAASLERALRIEPKNPRLWHELARVRLRQGDYQQAESTALRSNSWAGDDREIRAANQRLIDEARAQRR